jgi:hypothetical protein
MACISSIESLDQNTNDFRPSKKRRTIHILGNTAVSAASISNPYSVTRTITKTLFDTQTSRKIEVKTVDSKIIYLCSCINCSGQKFYSFLEMLKNHNRVSLFTKIPQPVIEKELSYSDMLNRFIQNPNDMNIIKWFVMNQTYPRPGPLKVNKNHKVTITKESFDTDMLYVLDSDKSDSIKEVRMKAFINFLVTRVIVSVNDAQDFGKVCLHRFIEIANSNTIAQYAAPIVLLRLFNADAINFKEFTQAKGCFLLPVIKQTIQIENLPKQAINMYNFLTVACLCYCNRKN